MYDGRANLGNRSRPSASNGPEKSEIVAFFNRTGRPPRGAAININGVEISMKPWLKYLGIILDSKLNFVDHFGYLQQKMNKVNRALFRLLPNLRGPHESRRRLYIIQSIVMYVTPVWHDKLMKSAVSRSILCILL